MYKYLISFCAGILLSMHGINYTELEFYLWMIPVALVGIAIDEVLLNR